MSRIPAPQFPTQPLELFDLRELGQHPSSGNDPSLLGAPEPSPETSAALTAWFVSAAFATWYEAYPRKRCKQDARNAYRAALRKGYSPAQLDAATRALIAEGREKTYVPYPATFLRRHLEDYLGLGSEEATATAREQTASPLAPICPTHGPDARCLWQVGAGWIHQR